jgi:NodT family efflux transporter outer membrane factor (OMF) lipoprotein
MRRLALPLALTSLCVSACAVGPTYRAPATPPTAAAPFVSSVPSTNTDAPPPQDWWRLYNDPVLDRLIGRAFVANTDLRAAEANLSEARAILREARVGLLPSTTLSGGAQYGRSANADAAAATSAELNAGLAGTGVNTAAFGPTTANASWTYDASFDVSYEVDLFGRVRRTIEAARGDAQAEAAARDAVKITVAAETARAYVDACAYAAEIEVANQSVKVLQDTYDLTLARRNAGAASDFDTTRQGALLEQTKATVPQLQGQRQASLFELAALIGLTPSQVPAEAKACKAAPTLASPVPVGDGALLLRRRPDVRQAERHLAAETARIGVAAADLYPSISLGGSIAEAGGQHGNPFSNRNVSYGIGPLISWTFPNIFAARARVAEAKATTRAALASFDGTVLTALKEAEQALSTYSSELDRNAALARASNDASAAYALAQVRFNAGAQSELDLLTTEQTLVSAKASLAASNETLADDQIQLFKALGGGWGAP